MTYTPSQPLWNNVTNFSGLVTLNSLGPAFEKHFLPNGIESPICYIIIGAPDLLDSFKLTTGSRVKKDVFNTTDGTIVTIHITPNFVMTDEELQGYATPEGGVSETYPGFFKIERTKESDSTGYLFGLPFDGTDPVSVTVPSTELTSSLNISGELIRVFSDTNSVDVNKYYFNVMPYPSVNSGFKDERSSLYVGTYVSDSKGVTHAFSVGVGSLYLQRADLNNNPYETTKGLTVVVDAPRIPQEKYGIDQAVTTHTFVIT